MAARLRQIRELLHISLSDFARLCGMKVERLFKYETALVPLNARAHAAILAALHRVDSDRRTASSIASELRPLK